MTDIPKVNVSPVLVMPLALGCQAFQRATQTFEKFQVGKQCSCLTQHPVAQRIVEKKEILLAALGVALILHGSQFKNLLLCTYVVVAFLFDRVKSGVTALWGDVTTAREKLGADSAAPAEEPASNQDEKSKHAKKRDAKKADEGKKTNGDKTKHDADAAKKFLKLMDSGKLALASRDLFAALLVCVVVVQGGLAQKVAIAHALVALVEDKVDVLVEFDEDVKAWSNLISRLALWLVILPLALFCTPLALALSASVCGARIVAKYGFNFVKVDAESKQGLLFLAALSGFGTLWQVWTWAAGGGVAWYFQLVYLPAVLAEGFVAWSFA